MHTLKCVYRQNGDAWIGYLDEFPDYWTQGETLDDLLDHLEDMDLDTATGSEYGPRATRPGEPDPPCWGGRA